MNANKRTAGEWETLLESFAAELTNAAYPIALQHGMRGSWVDLELDLWKAVAETVKKWGRELPRCR